jgi:pimeloyl-ACP methyl ester carboxylesterase
VTRLGRRLRGAALVAALGVVAACATPPPPAPPEAPVTFPQDLFARVNGVSLHYLDWGGTGDLLLLLPGWTHTAYTYAGIAPAFTDRFRVIGLTRRGHGASEKVDTGFTVDALVQDVVSFVDAIGATRVVLVGHSFGGRELPLVAARLGGRAAGLVFLDAVYDWPMMAKAAGTADINRFGLPPDSALASRAALEAWHRWRDPSTWGPVQAATLRSQTYLAADGRVAWQLPLTLGRHLGWMATTGTDYSAITVPTLAIWAKQGEPTARAMEATDYSAEDIALVRKWMAEVDVPVKQSGIEALKRAKASVTVVEMEAPHVLHWADPPRVVREMNRFLDGLTP